MFIQILKAVLPPLLSILFARYLAYKKYKVASIAWSVCFFYLFIVYFLVTTYEPIVNACIWCLGENLYKNIHEALTESFVYTHGAFGAWFLVSVFAYIALPVFVTVVVRKEVKALITRMRKTSLANTYKLQPDYVEYTYQEEHKHEIFKTYIVFSSFLC